MAKRRQHVEAKHMAALLVVILATPEPEVVKGVGALPFAGIVWENIHCGPQHTDVYERAADHVGLFTAHQSFGHALTGAIDDYRTDADPWHGRICAGKISAGFTADSWFAEFEAELRLETGLHARCVYSFRRSKFAPAEAGKLVWRT